MGQNYRFQLLAPAQSAAANNFGRTRNNQLAHREYLLAMQRLRGRVYLQDGAIQPCELTEGGCFQMPGDERSWHLLLTDARGQVIGCARYLVHSNAVAFDRLRISHAALAKDPVWGPRVRAAVEEDLTLARKNKFSYVEIGGWALAEEWRGSRAALEILVGSYALAHLWGGCLGACTATLRHGASSMLRRLGGSRLAVSGRELPAYDDPQYGCQMELLRFDCRKPAPRFAPLVQQLKAKLADVVAITPQPARDWLRLPGEVGAANMNLLRLAPLYS